jgi:leucyl-tRNA synthetase
VGLRRQAWAALAAAARGFDGASPPRPTCGATMHLLLRQVSHDYDRLQYNTVVSGAMKMLNAIDDAKLADSAGRRRVLREAFSILLRTLYPAAPHITLRAVGRPGFCGAATAS